MSEIETWSDWRRKYLRTAKQSPHEWEFLRLVLQEVPGLKPSQLTPQREFVGNDGRTLHMDFAIETPHVKIAIELEGWDKSGNGQGKSKAEHDHFNRRLQSLSAQGWEVLPITNSQFHADPVHYILDIGRRIDPRKFELPPVSPQTMSSAPIDSPPPPHVTEQPALSLSSTPQATSSSNGIMWAVIVVGLAIALLVAVLMQQNQQPKTTSPASPPADMDCPQFASQVEAQAWFDQYFPEFGDVGRLDRDGDGRVCTSTEYSK